MKTVEIGQVAKVTSSKRIFAKEYVADGIPFFRSKEVGELSRNEEVKTELFISESRYSQIKSKYDIPQKGDLLLTAVGSIGNTWIVDERKFYYKDGNLTLIKPFEKLDVNYLNYFFKSSYFWRSISSNSTGTAYSALTISTLNKIKIPLPSVSTQKRIAEILDNAAALRDKTKQLLTEYDQLAQSIFLDMFGDRSLFKIDALDNHVNLLNSKRVPVKSADRKKMSGEYPYYGASGIIDYVDDFLFAEETLLIGEDGANLLSRSTPIAFRATGKYWVNNHAHVISKDSDLNLVFLEYFINSINLEKYITGSAQPKLNSANLKKIKTPIPSIKLQNEFAEKIALIEQQKDLAKQELQESEDLFQALLQKAFKGELV